MPQLSNTVKTILCLNSAVAASTDITTAAVVDTEGYDGVRFIFGFGAITAGAATSTGVAGKSTNTPTPGTDDLAGSKITVVDTADNTIMITDIQHPQLRYMRPFVKRATQNAVVDFIIAELYQHDGKLPVVQDASVTLIELWDAPAVGTA
jgi:hypothetical protein